MCLSPVEIVNPSKYVSLKYRDRYVMQVPCGKCAECQSSNSLGWQFRTYVEFRDCLDAGGYVYYDTLTYRPKYLPHISDFVNCRSHDYPCFNHFHVTNFFKLLRTRLDRSGYDVSFKYFLSSEYGVNPKDGKTYRPHYHVLFFVYGDISPIDLSKFISDCWIFGRTDGFPYRSNYYVMSHNTILENSMSNLLKVTEYVTKYVQKSCVLTKELNKRVSLLMSDIDSDMAVFYDDDNKVFSETSEGRKYRLSIERLINQFHRQSLHFGESYLSELDLDSLFKDGFLMMPSSKSIKIKVPLPSYYKRKLFYNLVSVDGVKLWQLNDIGLQYREVRKQFLLDNLSSRLSCICEKYHFDFDCKSLADYVLNYRGRFKADKESLSILDRLNNISYYNYITPTDKEHFGVTGLSVCFHGVCNNYNSDVLRYRKSITDFILHHVFFDEEKESQLSKIYNSVFDLNRGQQEAFALKQRLTNLYRCFGL